MFITAAAGLCVNLMMMKILHQDVGGGSHGHSHAGGHGHSHGGDGDNINVRVWLGATCAVVLVCACVHDLWALSRAQAAFIHVIGDLVQSIGVVIASIIIW